MCADLLPQTVTLEGRQFVLDFTAKTAVKKSKKGGLYIVLSSQLKKSSILLSLLVSQSINVNQFAMLADVTFQLKKL